MDTGARTRAFAVWTVAGGLVATAAVLAIGLHAGFFDHSFGWFWALVLIAIFAFNCAWAFRTIRRSHTRPLSAPPAAAASSAAPLIRRWVGGGRFPADIGSLNATWPFIVAELRPGLLVVRVRGIGIGGAFGVPKSISFEPATTTAVFPARSMGRTALGIQPIRGEAAYISMPPGVLDDLRTAGFDVDPTPRKVSAWKP
ncbi:MAG: hypothetical protein ACT4P1_02765 [Sporichthyaceae bacterium]